MPTVYTQTIEEIVPNITARIILNGAMTKSFPGDREQIEQHLNAFAGAAIRYGSVELDTRSLQQYFRKACEWNEFQAIWYRSRIEEFLVVAKTNRRLGSLRE